MENNLGEYIKSLRKNDKKKRSILKTIEELKISKQYLMDIEKNKRIPSGDLLQRIINMYGLLPDKQIFLYDLAANSYKQKKIPFDIVSYIIDNEEEKKILREKIYKNFINEVEKNGNDKSFKN